MRRKKMNQIAYFKEEIWFIDQRTNSNTQKKKKSIPDGQFHKILFSLQRSTNDVNFTIKSLFVFPQKKLIFDNKTT